MAAPSTQEMLDNVRTAINAVLTGGAVKSYTVDGVAIDRYSLDDLLALESRLAARLSAEQSGGTRNFATFGGRG